MNLTEFAVLLIELYRREWGYNYPLRLGFKYYRRATSPEVGGYPLRRLTATPPPKWEALKCAFGAIY